MPKKWIKQGEEINNPVFVWCRNPISSRLSPCICFEYINQYTLNTVVERHNLEPAPWTLSLRQCISVWPKPKD